MEKTHDFVHRYESWSNAPHGDCVIQTYEAAGEPPIVVCSSTRKMDCTSITNICKYLAFEVVDRLYPHLLPPNALFERLAYRRAESWPPFVWIEHYPPVHEPDDELIYGKHYIPKWRAEKWMLTRFQHYHPIRVRRGAVGRPRIGYPSWEPIDQAYVEDLVGEEWTL